MRLEEQLAVLADVGLVPAPEADPLDWYPRERYEKEPVVLLLRVLGEDLPAQPWGRPVCERVWAFDTECVEDAGIYVSIVDRLCRVAGQPGALGEVRDHLDFGTGEAWVEYTVGGRRQRWDVELRDDWADLMVVNYVMDDLERDGNRFRFVDDGQAMVLTFLDDTAAGRLNHLAGTEVLRPVLP